MQITITIPEGATPSDIAAKLRFHAGLFEGMPPKEAASRKNTDASDDDEELAPPKKATKAKAQASFDDDAVDEMPEEEEQLELVDENFEGEPEEAPAPKKSAKPKAPTKEDVNDACKAHAHKFSFDKTKALLTKKFGTSSVSKLKPEQYPAVIAAMRV